MNDFLEQLKFLLSDLPESEVDEIVYDYKEHFESALIQGKSEADVIRDLGDVKVIAKQYRASAIIKKANADKTIPNIFNAIFATVALGFFNVVIVLGPFMAAFGIIIGMFGASIGISLGGLAAAVSSFGVTYLPIDIPASVSFPILFFTGIGLACLGILFFTGTYYLLKVLYIITLRYLKWNLRVIKGTRGGETA